MNYSEQVVYIFSVTYQSSIFPKDAYSSKNQNHTVIKNTIIKFFKASCS